MMTPEDYDRVADGVSVFCEKSGHLASLLSERFGEADPDFDAMRFWERCLPRSRPDPPDRA